MNGINNVKRIGALLFVLALAACGGSDDGGSDGGSSPGSPPVGTVIGAAGGTVLGPHGTKVVIPPGALTADTKIAITQTSASAPTLPSGLSTFGQMFAFTPHGTTFAVPVTVTLPFALASVPAGVTPSLYKTTAQNQWARIINAAFSADTVTAEVTSFSFAQVIVLPLQNNDPVRDWEFTVYSSDGSQAVVPGPDGSGTQTGGLLEKIADFGPAPLDEDLVTFTGSIPASGRAKGFVFGTADGVTYGVYAEAPFGKLGGINQPGGPNPIGSRSKLEQRQSFIKRAADASLTFTLTDVFVCGVDYNLFPPTFGTDDASTSVRGTVFLNVQAWTMPQRGASFFSTAGLAGVFGTRDLWSRIVTNFAGTSKVLWTEEDFDFTSEVVGSPIIVGGGPGQLGVGSEGCLELKASRTYTIDLSTVAVGEEFTVLSVAEADTLSRRGGGSIGDHQASGVHAYLRDPLSIGGTTLTFVGLEATNRPDKVPPVQLPVVPASCVPGPAPDPAAGVLQFSAASYTIDESAGSLPTITVTRTGGSRGAVSATFTTSDGTAIGGADYTPVNATVFFGDGDAAPRVVIVPIMTNSIDAPDKTVNLTLSQPGGCAALGSQTTAVLTIQDDDLSPPTGTPGAIDTGFGIAGKATSPAFGGDGSAMALQPDGKIVIVGGTFADFILARFNADGSLDASFGVGGKVTTDMVSGQQEEALGVAVQPDGKIVVVGYTRPGLVFNFALARYNADGTLDATFGSGGKIVSGVAGRAFAVAIQPADSKIVVAGDDVAAEDFALARYNANGTLDSSFGSGGKLTTDIGGGANTARNVVLQANGSIVVSGEPIGTFTGSDRTDLVRYNANGSLDVSFGAAGKVTLSSARVGEGLRCRATASWCSWAVSARRQRSSR